jgi:hypothetical protein
MNIKRSPILFLTAIFIAVSPACSSVSEFTATATPEPTATSVPTASLAPTSTPVPTRTPLPTAPPISNGAPFVHISGGSFKNNQYMSPEGNFECDFGDALNGGALRGSNVVLQDNNGNDWGAIWTTDDIGQEYGVDYFNINFFPESARPAFADPSLRQKSLEGVLDNLLLTNRQRLSSTSAITITHREFVTDDILFAIIHVPHGSDWVDIQDGNYHEIRRVPGDASTPGRLDEDQAYYIFTTGKWIYLVYYYQTPIFGDFGPDLQDQVRAFYEGCTFK